jgi:hypothetical protein
MPLESVVQIPGRLDSGQGDGPAGRGGARRSPRAGTRSAPPPPSSRTWSLRAAGRAHLRGPGAAPTTRSSSACRPTARRRARTLAPPPRSPTSPSGGSTCTTTLTAPPSTPKPRRARCAAAVRVARPHVGAWATASTAGGWATACSRADHPARARALSAGRRVHDLCVGSPTSGPPTWPTPQASGRSGTLGREPSPLPPPPLREQPADARQPAPPAGGRVPAVSHQRRRGGGVSRHRRASRRPVLRRNALGHRLLITGRCPYAAARRERLSRMTCRRGSRPSTRAREPRWPSTASCCYSPSSRHGWRRSASC